MGRKQGRVGRGTGRTRAPVRPGAEPLEGRRLLSYSAQVLIGTPTAPTTSPVSSSVTVLPDQPVTFNVTVGAYVGTAGAGPTAPTGAVTVYEENDTGGLDAELGGTLVAGGDETSSVSVAVPLKYGVGTFVFAEYHGDDNYVDSDSATAESNGQTYSPSGSYVGVTFAPTHFAFTQEPSDAAAHTAITPPPAVALEDASGAVDPYFAEPVPLTTIGTGGTFVAPTSATSGETYGAGTSYSGGVTVNPTLTVTAVNGVATYPDAELSATGTYTLANPDPFPAYDVAGALNAATSTSFDVTGDALSFAQAPTDGTATNPLTPTVSVSIKQSDGTVETADNTTVVTLATVGYTGDAKLTGNTATVVAGVATFPALAFATPGTYTLQATDDAADASATSGPFTIVGNHLVFTATPGDTNVDTAIPLSVKIVDPDGNLVDVSGTVVLSLNTVSDGVGAVLSGTTSAPLVDGVATFPAAAGPTINAEGSYTITATPEDTSTGTLAPIDGTAAGTSAPFRVASVVVDHVTTTDSKSLSIAYAIGANPTDAPVEVDVYRSADATYVAGDTAAVDVALLSVTGADAAEGTHSITVSPFGTAGAAYAFAQAQALRPDPTHKYLIATADQNGALAAGDATTVPQAGFRFWLIGAVTHGYVGSIPAVLNAQFHTDFAGEYQSFVDAFAAGLLTDGYDASIGFHWEYEADRAIPNQPVQQGLVLEKLVLAKESHLATGPDDVVDVNLIGWSRGTIVVNSALTAMDADPATPADIARGFICESLVDPHPANNLLSGESTYTGLDPATLAKTAAVYDGYYKFQAAVHDLQGTRFTIPSNVDAVSDMYQHNPVSVLDGSEALLNLWGLAPALITPNATTAIVGHLVTTGGVGHSEIMTDVERHVIQGNLTLQALNLYPFGSTTPAADAVAATPADQLAVRLPADPVLTGGPFTVTVDATDAVGRPDPTFTGDVTLSLAGLTGGTLGGTVTATAVDGTATFAGLTVSGAGTDRITATSTAAATGTSAWFAVSDDQLVVTTPPQDPTLGQPFGLTVSAVRGDGSVDTAFAGPVTLTANAEPTNAPAALGGVYTRVATGGTATFFGLSVPRTGDYLLTATAPGIASGTSDGFAVGGAAATHLVVADPPATALTTGAPFTLEVAAEDAAGDVDQAYAGPVTLTLAGGSGTLGGTVTAAAVGGLAVFTDLTVSAAGTGYAVTAAAAPLTAATVPLTLVPPGTAARLAVVTTAPADGVVAGTPFTVTVSAVDDLGTVDPSFTGTVTLSADSLRAAGVSVAGGLSAAAVAGVATFPGLSIDAADAGDSFTASAPGLAPAAPSDAFDVLPGPAASLVIDRSPGDLFPGVAFPLVVQAVDSYGNLAVGFAQPITLSLDPAAGQTLGGTVTVTADGGVAGFDDLTVPAAVASDPLTATAGSMVATTPVSAATDQLVVTTPPPGELAAGAPFTVAVSAETAGGVVDPTFTGVITVAASEVALGGTTSVAAVGGVATFAGLSVDPAGTYALTATTADPAAGGTASTDPFTVAAASPAASAVVPTFSRIKLPATAISGQPLRASLALTLRSAAADVSGRFTVELYADTSATLAGGQVPLGSFAVTARLRGTAGHVVPLSLRSLPASLPAGTYHLLAEVTDPTSATSLVASSQTITVAAPTDAIAASVAVVGRTTVAGGGTFTVAVHLTNAGNVDATGVTTVTVGLSPDGTTAPAALTTSTARLSIRPGTQGITRRLRVKVPAGAGKGAFYPFVTVVQPAQSATAAATATVTVT